MDITKIKLTQFMRKEAVKEAIQFKFKKRVDAYTAQMKKAITDYALSRKSNKLLIEEYANLSDEMKKLVRLSSSITIATVDSDDYEIKDILTIDCGMKYLDYGANDLYYPFAPTSNERNSYAQKTDLVFSKALSDTHFVFKKGSRPASIQKAFDVRKQLMADINAFAYDSYHALVQVKSLKEVREYIPALEQFIPIPEKDFTKMVPFSFFKKVNESINLR